jgi:GMP synthase (glutamine-hydrolysing)
MRPRVLVLDGSIYPDNYDPVGHWRALAGDAEIVSTHLPSGQAVPDLAGFTHMIVTGSEASITIPAPWYEIEAEAIRAAVNRRVPVLGSCFGHQMLAWALSHPDHTRRSPTPELGWIVIENLACDPLLDGLPRVWHSFACHFDEVVEPPPPWKVLARSTGAAVQVMRWGDAPVWGIQAHPEIAPAEGRALLEGFLTQAPALGSVINPALAQEPRDDGLAGEIVGRFLRLAVTSG